jgi:hypothetical protein
MNLWQEQNRQKSLRTEREKERERERERRKMGLKHKVGRVL